MAMVWINEAEDVVPGPMSEVDPTPIHRLALVSTQNPEINCVSLGRVLQFVKCSVGVVSKLVAKTTTTRY
jgi:hypothetical protein